MKYINNLKTYILKNKFNISVCIVLAIGIVIRIINIANIPNALSCDEVSSRI